MYETLMKVADFIEANPKRFSFIKPCTPNDDKGVACPIAWVGFFAPRKTWLFGLIKAERPRLPNDVCKTYLGCDETWFLSEMDRLGGRFWTMDHSGMMAVRGLRRIASEHYRPQQNANAIPSSVRAIFETAQSVTV
jgi:hypothetical protein